MSTNIEISNPNLHDPQAAWEFIQQAILIEDHCDLDAKEWHLQHPDTDPVIVGVVEVLTVDRNCGSKEIMAVVMTDNTGYAKYRSGMTLVATGSRRMKGMILNGYEKQRQSVNSSKFWRKDWTRTIAHYRDRYLPNL